jgi:hypothetical protein
MEALLKWSPLRQKYAKTTPPMVDSSKRSFQHTGRADGVGATVTATGAGVWCRRRRCEVLRVGVSWLASAAVWSRPAAGERVMMVPATVAGRVGR